MIAAFEFKIPSDGKKMDLYDVDGDVCGSVYLDTPSENLNTGRLLEIILLSRYNVAREVGMPYLRKKIETMRGLTRNNNLASTVEWPRKRRNFGDGKLNIMLIGWSEGIAERFGIGKIWTESVNFLKDPGLTWKEIVLG
ncbi:hypothetical protein DL95DRAFT_171038 [Leptodontidium sp. 2 PMI_412]|nr:hypothetical protein DL95DRAFT_171038 [Leptodontidium sp. 2 PMI_412]